MNCIKSIWMKIIKSWDAFWASYQPSYIHQNAMNQFLYDYSIFGNPYYDTFNQPVFYYDQTENEELQCHQI